MHCGGCAVSSRHQVRPSDETPTLSVAETRIVTVSFGSAGLGSMSRLSLGASVSGSTVIKKPCDADLPRSSDTTTTTEYGSLSVSLLSESISAIVVDQVIRP